MGRYQPHADTGMLDADTSVALEKDLYNTSQLVETLMKVMMQDRDKLKIMKEYRI
jgi:hypothetical protein